MAESEKRKPVKHRDLILETIDQLRKRKARPDKDRICHMLERRHGVSLQETYSDLEALVDQGTVVKVEYKGNTSYRNAAKWRRSHMGHVLNSNEVKEQIRRAVVTLTDFTAPENGSKDEADRADSGVVSPAIAASAPDSALFPPRQNQNSLSDTATAQLSPEGTAVQQAPNLAEKLQLDSSSRINHSVGPSNQTPAVGIKQALHKQSASLLEIENWLKLEDPETALVEKQLFLAVKREVQAGRLIKLPDNSYAIGNGIPLPKKISPAKQKKLQIQGSKNYHSQTAAPKIPSAETKSNIYEEKNTGTAEKKVNKKVKFIEYLIYPGIQICGKVYKALVIISKGRTINHCGGCQAQIFHLLFFPRPRGTCFFFFGNRALVFFFFSTIRYLLFFP